VAGNGNYFNIVLIKIICINNFSFLDDFSLCRIGDVGSTDLCNAHH